MEALRLGQASMIVFALIAVAFSLLRRELPIALGLVLAVAVMVKALPLVLVVYFILGMRWRVVLGALVGGLLLLGGMALVVGPQGLAAMRAIVGSGVGDSMRYQNEALARVPMWLGIWLTRRPSAVLLDAGYGLIALIALVFAAGVLVAGRRARRALLGRAEHVSSGSLFELLGLLLGRLHDGARLAEQLGASQRVAPASLRLVPWRRLAGARRRHPSGRRSSQARGLCGCRPGDWHPPHYVPATVTQIYK